ncbi:MAG: helix-turn-helix transcriptional regulator, partial [Planctomycetota bacterium]
MKGRPPSKEATDFGRRVAAARRESGLTQRELADRLGVSQKMVDYYERRAENVTANVVCRLSEILAVSADE